MIKIQKTGNKKQENSYVIKILLSLVAVIFFYNLILLSGTGLCEAQEKQSKESPWNISAGSLTYDSKKKLYIAEKEVLITGEQIRLEADYAEFSDLTYEVYARGNVVLISGEDSIFCDAFNMNLTAETGIISKGTIFIRKENFYLSGENIEKTGESTYKMKQGSLTSCAGENPDWKISGENINVKIEGYGTARNVVFWAKNIPTAYSPYLFFPVKTKRKSGLLIPRVSFSERKGFQYEQPLFLAISKNTDVTLYADYMSKRGVKAGVEYRYILDEHSKGTVFLDYMQDRKIGDETDKNKDFSFTETEQRGNTDRYWFRMKQNQKLPYGFNGKLDMDVVSDADYLLEFQKGFSGFKKTNEYFEKEFGRSLDGNDINLRKNHLNLSKGWSNYFFAADVIWYDNIVTKRNNEADTTLQTLPSLRFNAFKRQFGKSFLYYTFDGEYKSFYRKDTTASLVNGQRADIYPKAYLPMRLNKAFQFEPYLGARLTSWHTDDFRSSDGDSKNLRTRFIPDTGAQISTKMVRVFDTNSFAEKIKHELIPKLEYSFIPDTDQNNLPQFDSLDRISEQNLLTWSLTNYLISRKNTDSSEDQEVYTYNDFTYIKLYQSFDINKQKNGDPEPFSDLFFTGRFYPNKYFAINSDFAYSPYDNQFRQYGLGGIVRDKRGDMLTSEYRYNRDNFESLYSEIGLVLKEGSKRYKNRQNQSPSSESSVDNSNDVPPELIITYSIETNLQDNKTLETKAGLIWQKECWDIELARTESKGDVSIGFMVNLHNLGSL